jgi:hypothetical protein
MGCLYQITSPSGKSYIGITIKPFAERMREHEKSARLGVGWGKRKGPPPSMVVHRAMQKYGYKNFTAKELVRANDWGYLCDLERKAIVAFGTANPNGYNTGGGGEGAMLLYADEEIRKKHKINSRAALLRSWATPDGRAAHMSGFISEEYKKSRSRAMKEMWQNPNHRPTLEESLRQMRLGLLRYQQAKRIDKICTICGAKFTVAPHEHKRKLCSFECSVKKRTKKFAVECVGCKKIFYPRRSAVKRGTKHCSWECRYNKGDK